MNAPDPQQPSAEHVPADTYTHGHHASVLKSHTWRTIENSAAYLEPHLKPGLSLLDVGCGPGTITVEFAERLAPGRVLGIDVADDIITRAQAAVDPSLHSNVEFRVDDCYQLAIDDGSYDIVHAHQVLQHLSDPVAALKEMKRVVTDEGVVAVRDADYHGMIWSPTSPGLEQWMDIYQGVARRNQAEPDAGRHLLAWAHAAGFTSVTPSASTWCFAQPAQRSWWGGLWAERVTESSLATQAVEYGLATEQDLQDVKQAWQDWTNDPDGWFAVVNSELLLRP